MINILADYVEEEEEEEENEEEEERNIFQQAELFERKSS
jgi:hypothetical protein